MELQTLGPYRLLEPLPRASVANRFFLARHVDGKENTAPLCLAKATLPGGGESAEHLRAQFQHEGALLAHFNHPAIPSLRHRGCENGVDYLIMDFVDGVDLATLLAHHTDQPRALTKEIAVYLMGQLASALHHVHSAEQELDKPTEEGHTVISLEVLHRDICPANIFLSRDGDVVLGDFGSASSTLLAPEHRAKQAGHIAYMAPERVTGTGRATKKSDLFSLAVCLWEILKGRRCLQAEDELKTMDTIARFDISHSSRRVSGLSPKLSEIVRRNLDRDPSRRYTGAYQILQRLAQSPERAEAEHSRDELARLVNHCADQQRSGS